MEKSSAMRTSMAAMLFTAACVAPAPRAATAPAPLDDTVTVAYGRMARRNVTGAVSSVNGEEIESARATRVVELIQGRVPGLRVMRAPDGTISIRIRGSQGLGYSEEEPLIVIDGMPTQDAGSSNVLDALMPQDVARIDVLRDAGSTAAYGVRGANGVILITTKHGHD